MREEAELNDKHEPNGKLDLEAARKQLSGKKGRTYWRSLEEMSDTPQFQAFLEDEFPNRSTLAQINRRDLLKFMGASLALAGLSGCRGYFLPQDKVVPYVQQPEEVVPGKSLFYATSLTLGGYATGALVAQREGRPVNIQGNPDHPASLGALDSMSQAELLGLYDPDRESAPLNLGAASTWPTFLAEARKVLAKPGAKIRVLTGAETSPTLLDLLNRFLAKHPGAMWQSYEPVGRTEIYAGLDVNPIYDFAQAKVILSLDGDFLSPSEFPGSLAYARQFADGRRVQGKTGTMNRLYAFESVPGLVGMVADHRWPIRANEVYDVALAIAGALGLSVPSAGVKVPSLNEIVADLKSQGGASVVVAGPSQPAHVHALVAQINQALGAHGKTVRYSASIESVNGDIAALAQELKSGEVDLLLMLGGNPVYDAPADLGFEEAVKKAKLSAHLSVLRNETSSVSHWHLPSTHPLEEWGDARAYDGTVSLIQPIIAPIWDSKSKIELIAELLNLTPSAYDLVRAYWKQKGFAGGGDFEKAWRTAVHDGFVKGTAVPANLSPKVFGSLPAPQKAKGTVVAFRVDPTLYDGRYANNGWLQELPKPVTKLTWDNAMLVSPAFAKSLGVEDDDMIELTVGGKSIEGPILRVAGHPDNSVTVYLGHGHWAGGAVASVAVDEEGKHDPTKAVTEGGGFNAYLLRTRKNLHFADDVQIKKLGVQRDLATTQGHQPINDSRIQDERDVIREGTLVAFLKDPNSLKPEHALTTEEIKKENLYPEEVFESTGPQWGMTIDMNTCIGCNACVTACQAENNIPVVGKVQVMRHREMHWLRIDRYYSGPEENPQVALQPIACVHCEKAPCEPVCPVAATVHSHEGLNQMVYNRCVGTRYCSNNCPYKVRRFNYLNYSDNQPNFSNKVSPWRDDKIPGVVHEPRKQGVELLKMASNPEVTVRGRGVMEKCTFCVQRISAARIEAKKAGRDIADGEIVTACQQACPTRTIVFGNVADKSSAVSKLRQDPRSYLLLEELQTRPRTSHLAKLRNPNPAIESHTPSEGKA